ncbi:MAG: leucine-rich repeat domain-containing protein [Methanobacteriota archaeon]|nr:MAG: leucine-rich repeat domain-containing protein [Euryarchaeota archaeon]
MIDLFFISYLIGSQVGREISSRLGSFGEPVDDTIKKVIGEETSSFFNKISKKLFKRKLFKEKVGDMSKEEFFKYVKEEANRNKTDILEMVREEIPMILDQSLAKYNVHTAKIENVVSQVIDEYMQKDFMALMTEKFQDLRNKETILKEQEIKELIYETLYEGDESLLFSDSAKRVLPEIQLLKIVRMIAKSRQSRRISLLDLQKIIGKDLEEINQMLMRLISEGWILGKLDTRGTLDLTDDYLQLDENWELQRDPDIIKQEIIEAINSNDLSKLYYWRTKIDDLYLIKHRFREQIDQAILKKEEEIIQKIKSNWKKGDDVTTLSKIVKKLQIHPEKEPLLTALKKEEQQIRLLDNEFVQIKSMFASNARQRLGEIKINSVHSRSLHQKKTQLERMFSPSHYHGTRIISIEVEFLSQLEKMLGTSIPMLSDFQERHFGIVIEDERITELYLSSKDISTLPQTIGELNCLKVLNLNWNRFEELPRELKKLKGLRELHLVGNPLSREKGNISILKYLINNGCKILGYVID